MCACVLCAHRYMCICTCVHVCVCICLHVLCACAHVCAFVYACVNPGGIHLMGRA